MTQGPPNFWSSIGFGLRIVLLACGLLAVCWIVLGLFGELVPTLLFGWWNSIGRMRLEMEPKVSALATIGSCATTLLVGFHLFACWLSRAIQEHRAETAKPWHLRWSATIVGLALIFFLAGIAAIGVVHQTLWLSTSPEPIYKPSGPDRFPKQ
jgi:hypothetical protein